MAGARRLFSGLLFENTAAYRALLLKTALGALTAVLGLAGFIQVYHPSDVAGFVDCIFRTIQLLFAQFPPALATPSGATEAIPLTLNVARFAMPLLFVWVAASALVNRIRQPLRAAGVELLEGHAIMTGEAPLVPALLRARRRQRLKSVVICSAAADPLAEAAAKLGATVVVGETADAETWRRSGLKRARSALILGPDDAACVAAALAVADAAGAERDRDGAPVDVVCLIEEPGLRTLVESTYRGRMPLPGLTLQTNSSAEVRARTLLRHHPLYRGIDVARSEAVRALIVGFDRTGEQIALQIIKSGMVDEAAPASITAVDRQAGRLERSFRARHADAPPLDAVRFIEADIDAADAQTIALLVGDEPAAGANVIYLCLDDDAKALLTAVAIRRALAGADCPAPAIYCRQRGVSDLAARLASAEIAGVDLTRIYGFGQVDGESLEALTGDALDRRARTVHEYYLRNFPAAPGAPVSDGQRPWPLLSEVFRQASRDQADYLPMRLACLGLREGPTATVPIEIDDALVERAARTEHARWSASVQLLGWRYGPARDNDRRLHPNLVPYEALNEGDKDKDRAVLKDVAGVLQADGAGLRRLTPVPVDLLASQPPPPAPGRGAAAETVGESLPVLVSSLPNAQACEALYDAVANGPETLWRLVLPGGVLACLEAFDDPAVRDKARWLINNADQVLCGAAETPGEPQRR